MRRLLVNLIHGYQFLFSPWLGSHCRFYPSCSNYAVDAVQRYGVWYGSWLAIRRLLRCHPWSEGGVDLVPERECSHRHG